MGLAPKVKGIQIQELVITRLLSRLVPEKHLWSREPQSTVMVNYDQRIQFSSYDWPSFLKVHNLEPSMSRRGNCHDNVVTA